MPLSEDDLRTALTTALQELAEKKDESLAATLRPIIERNLSRGRIQSFLNGHENPTPRHYVWRVVEIYERLHSYLVELQEQRSSEVWLPLYKDMSKTAQHYFLRCGLPETKETRELAEESARETSARILTSHFPYDVEFQPWMYVVLRNVCSGKLKNISRIVEKDISELEESLADSSIPSGRQIESDLGRRNSLLLILEKLTPTRKQVIFMHYFEGRTFQEIAVALNKTVNAIHQLHFYALRDLEKLFNDE